MLAVVREWSYLRVHHSCNAHRLRMYSFCLLVELFQQCSLAGPRVRIFKNLYVVYFVELTFDCFDYEFTSFFYRATLC